MLKWALTVVIRGCVRTFCLLAFDLGIRLPRLLYKKGVGKIEIPGDERTRTHRHACAARVPGGLTSVLLLTPCVRKVGAGETLRRKRIKI